MPTNQSLLRSCPPLTNLGIQTESEHYKNLIRVTYRNPPLPYSVGESNVSEAFTGLKKTGLASYCLLAFHCDVLPFPRLEVAHIKMADAQERCNAQWLISQTVSELDGPDSSCLSAIWNRQVISQPQGYKGSCPPLLPLGQEWQSSFPG